MNKSTPLVQLPSNQPAQNFVNDQQRQYISQAQQAISNTTIPQNSQLSADIVNDDDMVVQDILNQINSTTQNPPQQVMVPNVNMQNFQQPPPNVQTIQDFQTLQNLQAFQAAQANMPLVQGFQDGTSQEADYKTFFFQFADDIKLAALVFFVVIIVHFVPLSSWVSKYIAVDKIPYHEIILRAILVTLLVVILTKLVKI